ncbi:hypothetical protein Trydic_g1071 [Trypoxylus dichotomus]
MDYPVPAPRNPKNINLRPKRPERPPRKRDIELSRRPTTPVNTEDIVKNYQRELLRKLIMSTNTEDTTKNYQRVLIRAPTTSTNTEGTAKNYQSEVSIRATTPTKMEDTIKNLHGTPGSLSLITKEHHANTTTHQGMSCMEEVYRNSQSIVDQKANISEQHDSKSNRSPLISLKLFSKLPTLEIRPWRSTKN